MSRRNGLAAFALAAVLPGMGTADGTVLRACLEHIDDLSSAVPPIIAHGWQSVTPPEGIDHRLEDSETNGIVEITLASASCAVADPFHRNGTSLDQFFLSVRDHLGPAIPREGGGNSRTGTTETGLNFTMVTLPGGVILQLQR